MHGIIILTIPVKLNAIEIYEPGNFQMNKHMLRGN